MRTAVGIVFAVFVPGLAISLLLGFSDIVGRPEVWRSLAIGVGAGVLLWSTVLNRRLRIGNLIHEWGHAAASLMLGRKVKRFTSDSDGGGAVVHEGGAGGVVADDFIGLAPYCFPPVTLVLALLRPGIVQEWHLWYDGLLGMSLGVHLCTIYRDIRGNWHLKRFRSADSGEMTHSDIGRRGYLFSGVFIATLNLIFLGVITWLVAGGYGGVANWGKTVFGRSVWLCRSIFDGIVSLVQ